MDGKNLTVKTQVDEDLMIRMNILHPEAILINILENTVKYSNEDGEIIVTGESYKDYIKISISDTGIGISPDEITRIFDEFCRAEPSRHDRDSHGLGLSIVKKLWILQGIGPCREQWIRERNKFYCKVFENFGKCRMKPTLSRLSQNQVMRITATLSLNRLN